MKGTYNFRNHTKGDTFRGREITFNLDLTGCDIIMQFRKNYNSNRVYFEWKTSNGTFNIIDAENGKIRMLGRILDAEVGSYIYDLQITFPSGEVITYLKGSINIENGVSR